MAVTEKQLVSILKNYWGHPEFRPVQKEIILSITAGNDTLAILPTGGGKSLCYQVPALASKRGAVVVSPLISLMHDQVANLKKYGISAAYLNHLLSQEESYEVRGQWLAGELSLLYVSPERIALPGFQDFLEKRPPGLFAVDEAHCISEWGHDFRPEYRQLAALRERFKDVPWSAFTATATSRVKEDITRQLGLKNPAIFVGDFYRPNLHYRVEPRIKGEIVDQVAEVLESHRGESGIVYCFKRDDVEKISASLNKKGFKTIPYHAGLPSATRQKAQRAFREETVDAIVATIAFGMGIDRANVRFVVHTNIPASLEAYQQETGRAGRDGLPAECVLFYTYADFFMRKRIITSNDREPPLPQKEINNNLRRLDIMKEYADKLTCRHKFLVEHFGQKWNRGSCENCDYCEPNTARRALPPPAKTHAESTRIAQMILCCVVRLEEKCGIYYTASVLKGAHSKVQPADCKLSTYGLLKDKTEEQIRKWIVDCLEQGFLRQTQSDRPVLKVTKTGGDVIYGRAEAKLSAEFPVKRSGNSAPAAKSSAKPARKSPPPPRLTEREQNLFDRLQSVCTSLVGSGKSSSAIPDELLRRIAMTSPSNRNQLLNVLGMTEEIADRFGDALVAVTTEHIRSWRSKVR